MTSKCREQFAFYYFLLGISLEILWIRGVQTVFGMQNKKKRVFFLYSECRVFFSTLFFFHFYSAFILFYSLFSFFILSSFRFILPHSVPFSFTFLHFCILFWQQTLFRKTSWNYRKSEMLRRPKIRFPKCLENTSLKIKPSTVAFSSSWSQKNQRYAFCCWKTCNIEFQKCSLNRKRVSLSCNCCNTGGMHKLFTKMLPFFMISFFL